MVTEGAGEVIVQSVDRDGTGSGLDLDLVSEVAQALPVPVVAAGGVGSLADIRAGVDAGASAVAAGSFFVFHGPRRAVLITYPDYGTLESLLGSATSR
jgi:cyclase